MTLSEAKKEIARLKKDINYHNYRYYVLNDPVITDHDYDQLYKKLQDLEQKFPRLATRDSPTRRIGGEPLNGFKTVEHKIKMLSLDNTYSEDELREFDDRMAKLLSRPTAYEATLKVDGVAVSLHYKDGVFALGATRGDGIRGDDITQNLMTIRSIPMQILGDEKDLGTIEVRGEVYLPKKAFERINDEHERMGEPRFANPRNAAAGTLKLLDPREVAKRGLDIFIHTIVNAPGAKCQRHSEVLKRLHAIGFKIVPGLKVCATIDDVIKYVKEWEDKRDRLEFEVDGLVVKVDYFRDRDVLGYTIKSPRWAIAYKYPARQAITRLNDIHLQVGRTGRITPVAVLEPVPLSGSTISRATLHNEDEIKRKDIRVGDHVIIEKGGEVIPKVVGVIKDRRTGGERQFRFPAECPVCLEKSFRLPGEADWRCVNASCPAQIKGAILHFASRPAMDIEGLGYMLVSKLVDAGLLSNFDDIYSKLDTTALSGVERMGEKSARNLVEAIEHSKEKDFSNVLYALGIPNVGINASSILVTRFRTVDEIMKADEEQLSNIMGIGPVIAAGIVDYFHNARNKKLIENLRLRGLKFKSDQTAREAILKGKTFIFTGELTAMTREDAQALVRKLGGQPSTSVSRKTDFVVAGSNPGSKYDKAQKLGVKTISEKEFLQLIKEKKK
ncbi:MAG TPA: NAD-dependent DNA ligase LigA [bacterium]